MWVNRSLACHHASTEPTDQRGHTLQKMDRQTEHTKPRSIAFCRPQAPLSCCARDWQSQQKKGSQAAELSRSKDTSAHTQAAIRNQHQGA